MNGLPMWTRMDVVRLKRRVTRAQPSPIPEPQACPECQPNHEHAAWRVGPYVLCRCLRCPVLVVQS